jgi:L-lactate utilization protein LutC
MTDSDSAREEILRRLRVKVRPADRPARWQSRRQFDDLAGRFTAALTAAGGEVHRAAGLPAALETLASLLRDLDARRIVANDEPPLSAIVDSGLFDEYIAIAESPNLPISNLQSPISLEWHIVGKSPGNLRAFCATADVGLSGADAGLAESGTIVVSSGPGKSRLATLMPPVHVALLATGRLTADLFTWTAARQSHFPAQYPANVILISGPS